MEEPCLFILDMVWLLIFYEKKRAGESNSAEAGGAVVKNKDILFSDVFAFQNVLHGASFCYP